MSREASQDGHNGGLVRIFDFESGPGWENQRFRDLFFAGPVAEWARERMARRTERITPQYLYVLNPDSGNEHHVAWVYHAGANAVENQGPFSYYHVVCDCFIDNEPTLIPDETNDCRWINAALSLRADFWSKYYGIPGILGELSVFDETNGDFALSPQGQELATSSIIGLLDMDRRHPQKWSGNFISGSIGTETVAEFLQQPEKEVGAMIAILNHSGLIEYNDGLVRLPKAA